MTAASAAPTILPVLKGDQFTQRMASLFASDAPAQPLPDLKYSRIVIPAISGGELHFAMLGLIAKALQQRGADVTVLLCDAILPACAHRKIDHYESACTRWCHRNAGPFANAMRLTHRWYSEFISPEEIETCMRLAATLSPDEIPDFCDADLKVGHLVMQSTTSYFKVGAADFTDAEVLAQARRLAASAMIMHTVARRAIAQLEPDKVFMDNGVQVDWGVFRAAASQANIPVDVVQTAPRPQTLQFEFDRPGNDRIVRMPLWEQWKNQALTASQERDLDAYLASRERVPYLFKNETWAHRVTNPAEARQLLNLPQSSGGLTFVMFTNVGYDEGVTKGTPAFITGAAWIARTVEFFAAHPQHTLIIKAHPGEKHLGARDPIDVILDSINASPEAAYDESARKMRVPRNVHIIDAASPITAPCAARLADVTLLYTSTVTVEAAAMNIPMILVGDGLHSRRGFAHEPATASDYITLLERICTDNAPPTAPGDIGRRYAYAYFFRSAIPITHFDRLDHELSSVNLRSASDLANGKDAALDAICNGILRDEPIINTSA